MKNIMASFTVVLPFFAILSGVSSPVLAADKPNIILMISDDHRWDAIGLADNPNIHTPNMDRLGTEGIYFSQATIHNPQCSPSRAAMLTGLATHANGRYSNQSIRADINNPHGFDQYHCLPEALADNGYATALVGKWHLAPDPWNVGFQEVGTWMPAGAGPFKGASLAKGKSRETKPHEGFTQEAFGDSARDVIRQHADKKSTQPLFMWLAMTAPHSPYQPNPEEAVKPYEGKTTEDVYPPKTYQGSGKNIDKKAWLDYVAAITSVDLEIGKILKTLDESGLSSNTILAFIGDNGFMMGNREIHGKVVPWEDSVRVPMMVWGPGVFKGKGKSVASVSSLDLPPTFLKLAGADFPAEWHGRDFTPVLEDGMPHDLTWSVSEHPDYQNWKFPGICYRTVRTTESKLIVWHEKTGKTPEFYQIDKDPQEQKNLYNDPAVREERDRLQGILDAWMKKTNDTWEMPGLLKETDRGTNSDDAEGGKRQGKKARKNARKAANTADE